MGLYATSVTFGAPVKPVAATDAEVRARIEDQRALIDVVPGEGSVLGVWVFGATTYAFRNKVGGATAGMYKSSSTGWVEVNLGQVLDFDGTTTNGEPVPGNLGSPTTIRGGTSGAEGSLMGISYYGLWETGGTGGMVLKDVTGTFQDDEDLQMPLLAFGSGAIEIVEGDVITGAASGKTANVTSVTLTGGAWDGSASGSISVKDNTGTWNSGENIQVGGVTRATVSGASQPSNVKIAVAKGVLYNQSINPGGNYEFVTYNFRGESSGISMYGVNSVDKGFAFDGTTFVKNFTGQEVDQPQHVHAHQKHLFYSYANGSIQNSSIIAPNKWSTITGAAELSIGDVVSGFSTEVNNVMSVFTRNDAYMLYGTSAADWSLRRFHAGAGAIPHTIQKMDQTFFLDDRGLTSIFTVQYFGDFQSAVASDKVDPYIQAKKESTVTSLRVRGKNQYRIYFNDKTGLEMTFINKTNQGLMPFTLKDQIVCTCSVEDTNGFEVLYGGFDDGYVRRLDSGTSFDGGTVDSFIRSAYYHYDAPGMRKRFRQVNLEINADTSTTLTVFPDYDFGGTFDPKTSPVSDAYSVDVTADGWNEDDVSNPATGVTVVASERLKINGIGTNMSLIIKNSSIYDKPITLQGAIVDYSPRGIRR
jgi:hypothetical protein